MAKDANPYICDICDTHKRETNHWFLGLAFTEIGEKEAKGAAVVVWDADTANDPDVKHLCGIACALKWMGQQLQQISVSQT